jgi:hypothetical protein
MPQLQTRLRRLEAALPEPQPKSELAELVPYLFGYELHRLYNITVRACEQGGGRLASDEDAVDVERLLNLALQRQCEGWQLNRIDPRVQELERIDTSKRMAVWQLIFSLRRRHTSQFFTELSDCDTCDLLDLEPEEIFELAQLVGRARSPEDLKEHAAIAARVRLRGKAITPAEFERLVFEGVLP